MKEISFKEAKNKGLILIGSIILSYSNRKGEFTRGIIIDVTDRKIEVDYKNRGRTTLNLEDGKLFPDIDTNLDIALVSIEE